MSHSKKIDLGDSSIHFLERISSGSLHRKKIQLKINNWHVGRGLRFQGRRRFGVCSVDGGESLIQNVKSTFGQMASKESVTQQVSYSKIEDVQRAEKASTTVDNILRKTKCTNSDLQVYLKSINSDLADEYLKMGKWPEKVQIPKSPEVLKLNGKIDWS